MIFHGPTPANPWNESSQSRAAVTGDVIVIGGCPQRGVSAIRETVLSDEDVLDLAWRGLVERTTGGKKA